MNLRPIKDHVVVLPDPPVTRFGLIHVPETVTKDNPNYFPETGRVVALGRTSYTDDGEAERPFDVSVGDRVHFNRYAGKQITCDDDGITYLVMREREIDGIVMGNATVLHGYQAPTEGEISEFKDASGRPIDPRAA